jgi:hypothetical protein
MTKMLKARIALACMAAFVPMGCAATPKPTSAHIEAAEADPIAGVSFSARSWGNIYENWTIGRVGNGRYASADNARAPLSTARAFKGEPADFDTVLRDLSPLEQQINRPLHCFQMWTDQDTLTVTWARQGSSTTLELYSGCRSPAMTELWAALQKARAHVTEMTTVGKAQ